MLAAMIAKHRWGTPISRDHLISISAIDVSDHPRAREVFDDLCKEPYITIHGNRGIELDSSRFGELADVLYDECGWEPYQIKSRLKHYQGWDDHDWS